MRFAHIDIALCVPGVLGSLLPTPHFGAVSVAGIAVFIGVALAANVLKSPAAAGAVLVLQSP
ncbi:MAG TPA: hypothetical protein VGK90_03395 [Rhizomicrobium sp.]